MDSPDGRDPAVKARRSPRHAALLLDYGGVLTTSVLASFASFCNAEGIDVDVFRRVVLDEARAGDSIFVAVETGRIDQDEFDQGLAALLSHAVGTPIRAEGLKQRMFAASRPDERMCDAVRRARAGGIRTALVSNSWGGHDYPRELLAELCNEVIISGEAGLRKPDPEIYLLAAERLDVEPKQCVFVDDFLVNVEGADAVGMTGMLHRDAGGTIPALERLLGLSLDGVLPHLGTR